MEEAIETQASVGTEPVTEQAMLGESPLRTIASLLGVNQQATVPLPYEFNPLRSEDVERPRSAPPLMGMVVQGVNMQNDGITEFSRMQNNSPNDFNGPGVEGGDMGQEGLDLYEDVVLERLSAEQVKDVARLLIEYVKDEVPIENWEGQPPAKTVNLLRMLLKSRDKVTTEGMQAYRMALEKEFRKSQRLSQEIISAEEEARLAQEAEVTAKEEVNELVRLMEESGQRIEELEAELASATQEVENFRASLESVQQELDNLRFENARGPARISEGHGRRATLLRSNGDLTVVGVLQALKGSPKTSSTSNPALQKTYDAALDFLMEQAIGDCENNVQDRMIKTPLKQADLGNLLKEVGQVVMGMRKFTLAMGEKPEKIVAYILEVLGKLGQQRVALMDAMRAAKDAGGSALKALQTYYGIRNSARDAATTAEAKADIMAASGDDGRVLGKIVELAFVPISTALAREMLGDSNHHGIRDIGHTLQQGFTAFTAAVRLMAKADPKEMANDFFELALMGSEWFVGKEARCLEAFELLCIDKLTVLEAKYGTISFEMYLQSCKVRALLQDSKGDPTINACNRTLQNQERFQQEQLSWITFAPVFNDFYQAHVQYEQLHGEPKINLRNKRQAELLTNGDVREGGCWRPAQERDGDGGRCCCGEAGSLC